MYAKIFEQILNSSIAKDWQVRLVFEDFLLLAQPDGTVDMTVDTIVARTRVPKDIVLRAIAELEKPDPESRTPAHEGRRIVRLTGYRSWGWKIVNHQAYREIKTEFDRKAYMRDYMVEYRKLRKTELNSSLTALNSSVICTLKEGGTGGNNLFPVENSLPPPLNTPEFYAAWADWLAYRKEIRKKLTEATINRQLKVLAGLGPAKAVESINNSIRNGWRGLFEPQPQNNGHSTNKKGPQQDPNTGTFNEGKALLYDKAALNAPK